MLVMKSSVLLVKRYIDPSLLPHKTVSFMIEIVFPEPLCR